MNYKNKHQIDIEFLRETYDDEQLEMMEEEDDRSLVRDLAEYSNELIEQILELRKEVNSYDRRLRLEKKENMTYYRPPYDDLYSDICRDFSEHQVYEKYKDELDKMFN
jgi:molecular chaperone GrpE (heat shock protein)